MGVALELGSWPLNPASATNWGWDPRQVTAPLCLSFPSSKTGC